MQIDLINLSPMLLTFQIRLWLCIFCFYFTLYMLLGGKMDQKSPQLCLLCAGGQVHKELGGVHHQVDEDLFFDSSIFVGKLYLINRRIIYCRLWIFLFRISSPLSRWTPSSGSRWTTSRRWWWCSMDRWTWCSIDCKLWYF